MKSSNIYSLALTLGALAMACTSSANDPDNDPDLDTPSGSSGTAGSSGGSSGAGGASSSGALPAGDEVRFFLPTGEPDNTSAPSVELDPAGGIHALYPAYAGGDAYYAYCPADCAGPEATQVVRFDTDSTVSGAMLALDAEGRPRVLLDSYDRVTYAECDADCGESTSWRSSVLFEHGSDKSVTGESFALDAQGRPRFVMHTYVALFGIGQKPPKTEWVSCDADCLEPASWTASTIVDQIWRRGSLRFDRQGGAHLAAIALVDTPEGFVDVGTYQYCAGDCGKPESWVGPSFGPAYASETEAVRMLPSISLALTSTGAPRVLFLAKSETGEKNLDYFECDQGCSGDGSWAGIILSDDDAIDDGIDLTLDAQDRPRGAFTLNFNIGVIGCDSGHCTDTEWFVRKVEAGQEMEPDAIFPYPGCNVGMWFLHGPSLALTADGRARVGYQARDISGSTTGQCAAGTDMTFARLAVLAPF